MSELDELALRVQLPGFPGTTLSGRSIVSMPTKRATKAFAGDS